MLQLSRSRRPRKAVVPGWRALAAVLVGVLLVSIGTGIGVPHVAKTGWSPASIAASAALVAGLAALVFGIVAVTRIAHGWRRLALAPAVVLVAVVAVYVMAIPLAVTVVPPTRVGDRTPASLGMTYREVSLPTRDGIELSGWYVPSRTGAALVLLHGSGSTKASGLAQAAVLAGHGYGVLLLDARGHGDSAGKAMDWGWRGDEDTDAAVTFLAAAPDVDPLRIAAVGLSMGGEEAIGAAATDGRIRAVVAEGVTGRSAPDLHWLSDVYGWRGHVQEGLEIAHTQLVDVLTAASPPVTLRAAAAQTAPRPVLLIAAGDVPDEQHAATDIRQSSPGNVRVWVVPGSGHTGGLRTSPARWEQHVIAFLDDATS